MKNWSDSNNYLWYPFTYHQDLCDFPPIPIIRGEGLYVIDAEGKRYIDGIGSWWLSVLGHCHPQVTAAMKRQLDTLEHVIMAGFITEPAARLAILLQKALPAGVSRIFYSDDGSTAVEAALKIALQYWALRNLPQRKRFVAFGGGYHGDTLGAMSVGSIAHYHTLFHEQFCGHLFTDQPNCYRCPCGKEKESCNAECMDSLERILERHGTDIAAFIFEPLVQGAAGMRIYPPKVLIRAFALCEKYKVLTIADEIAMGFGRTGTFFACEQAGVVADIICMAKGLTAGHFPLAATAVKESIYDEFKGGFPSPRIFHHGHSFTGNPVGAAAACATLDIYLQQDLPRSVHPTMDYFKTGLKRFNAFERIGEVRSIGMIGALEFVSDRATKQPLPAEKRICHRIARRAIEKGLLIRPLGNVIYFIPSLLITREQIDAMFSIAHEAIGEILDEK